MKQRHRASPSTTLPRGAPLQVSCSRTFSPMAALEHAQDVLITHVLPPLVDSANTPASLHIATLP